MKNERKSNSVQVCRARRLWVNRVERAADKSPLVPEFRTSRAGVTFGACQNPIWTRLIGAARVGATPIAKTASLVGVCCNAICHVDHWLLYSLDETGAWPVEILDKKDNGGH